MIKKIAFFYVLVALSIASFSQNKMEVNALITIETKTITISQSITYNNTSQDTWKSIYLNDWNNSYATKTSPLAKRFEEEFSTKFHLAKSKERGFTTITHILDANNTALDFEYLESHPDIIKVNLKQPIPSGESYTLNLSYTLVLPNATFTDYGVTDNGNLNLKYWYITPTAYTNKWHYYSNKNLDDLFVPSINVTINITYPNNYTLISELNEVKTTTVENQNITTSLAGNDRVETFLALTKTSDYNEVQTMDFSLITNIKEKKIDTIRNAFLIDRITNYITNNLGEYPHQKMLITTIDYGKNPLYGLNQLPDFLAPFPVNFQYELKLLKTALKKYLDNTLHFNPRRDYWLSEGIQIYFLMKYVEDFYPDIKLFGNLANVWGLRSFHAASLDFNYQYYLYFMEMARKNNDQALTTSKDSLVKFNANIAGKYKAGLGLRYLDDYATDINMATVLKSFIKENKLKSTTSKTFENYLNTKTTKNINWFFNDYVGSRKKIDFKIEEVTVLEDSVKVTIKNKRNNAMPVPLFKLQDNYVLDKVWIDSIADTKTITLPKDHADTFVLDHQNLMPEFNRRDNYKTINGKLFNKPLQFRLFKDIEDPNYNQVFFMPLVQFNNIYDGLTLGTRVYNKTLLRRRLNYRFSPQYATNSRAITGSASVFYTHNIEDKNLFSITYGVSVGRSSFGQDAFVTRIRPSLEFIFRDNTNFRKDTRDRILARYINIKRTLGPDAIVSIDEPDYGVFNLRYRRFTPGLINFSRFGADFQVANKFSKLSAVYEFRKLTKSNRNINLRLYAGTFLSNTTNSDYFSFALDRPTDYLFDLNYIGRTEATGLISQQIIIAEGGFKSQLNTPFANQWLTTANFSTSIWRYIQAYGDVGLVKNKHKKAAFVYDAGVRLNLVEDYFEIYFPFYSNLGWEIAQPNYSQKIRFMFTIDPQALLGLFRRKWY